jgi:hypothetical protein
LYKPAYEYEMRKRAGSGWNGGKKKTGINRRDKDTMQKEKGGGCQASIRQPPTLPKLRRTIALN